MIFSTLIRTKKKNIMKNLLLLITILMAPIIVMAQDTFFQNSNENVRSEAIRITTEYNRELAFSGEQELLFRQKVAEFLIRKNEIEKAFSGQKKIDLLSALQREETREMNDILTRLQMEFYRKVKPQIQPVKTVEKK